MHWEASFRDLAGGQGGAIGRDQLPSIGCSWQHWGRARRNGRWEVVTDRVLHAAGSRPTGTRRAHAAIQDAGGDAVLHGRSAWFGLRGFDLSDLHVARRRGHRNCPSSLAVVHRLRDLGPGDVVIVRGVPTVTALRAIWSEASRYSSERWHDVGLRRIGRLLDDAHRADLVSWAALHHSIDLLAERGAPARGCCGSWLTNVGRERVRRRVATRTGSSGFLHRLRCRRCNGRWSWAVDRRSAEPIIAIVTCRSSSR